MGSLLKSQAVKKIAGTWQEWSKVSAFPKGKKNPVNLGISSLFLPKSLSNSNPLAPSVLSINKQPSEGHEPLVHYRRSSLSYPLHPTSLPSVSSSSPSPTKQR